MTIDDMQLVCDYILKQENKLPVRVFAKKAQCSRAYINIYNPRIRIGNFVFDYPDEVQLAEIIHESCHFIYPHEHHGKLFRDKEIYWLSQFGLKPVCYRKAYYTYVKTLNGALIPTRPYPDDNVIKKQTERQKLIELSKTIKKRKSVKRIKL